MEGTRKDRIARRLDVRMRRALTVGGMTAVDELYARTLAGAAGPAVVFDAGDLDTLARLGDSVQVAAVASLLIAVREAADRVAAGRSAHAAAVDLTRTVRIVDLDSTEVPA